MSRGENPPLLMGFSVSAYAGPSSQVPLAHSDEAGQANREPVRMRTEVGLGGGPG